MSGDGLPPLREVIARHGLAAKKSLGQNFLLDLNLTGRIARQAGRLEEATVIEVGPGPGGLTRALLLEGAVRVVAVERDARCLDALAEIAEHYPGRLEIVSGDALEIDFAALAGAASAYESLLPASPADPHPQSLPSRGREARPSTPSSPSPPSTSSGWGGAGGGGTSGTAGDVRIVANLPYNIGTELLVRWLTARNWPPFYRSMTLMFQREVAERIVAPPGSSHYGRLGVLAGWRTEARIAFDVPRQAFTPPPKITSSVVHIVPRESPLPCDVDRLARVTEAAFGQRRKMLRQSLKRLGGEHLLQSVGIDPTRRAETLSVAEFVALANAV